jgi:colanic acid/amylovoran biosynthesis glycosyltransferase
VWLFAIRHERGEILQPGAARYRDRLAAISDVPVRRALGAQLRLAGRRPGLLLRMWWRAIRGNVTSPKFLLRAVVAAWGAPALAESVTAQGVDRLHAHWGTHSALLAHLLSLLTGAPYSVTLHAHDLHVEQTMLAEKLRGASDVVTISEHNAELIRRNHPDVADRTVVVHCGVDTRALSFRPPDQPDPMPARIVTVAGLRAFKGHRYLLDALALLRARGSSVACDLVGDGPLRDELEAVAGDDVVFHGAVDVGAALEIVQSSTLFVMPSVVLADGRRDGIPVALIEAMALGVPVIATDVSGIPELVRDGDTGVLVPQRDAAALAEAIESLLDDPPRRRQLAVNARKLVEQEFDIADSGRVMAALFRRSRGE